MLVHGWSWKVTADTCSNPATHHPVSVVQGNSTSISAMVQVDDNLELNEEAFKFLINHLKDWMLFLIYTNVKEQTARIYQKLMPF